MSGSSPRVASAVTGTAGLPPLSGRLASWAILRVKEGPPMNLPGQQRPILANSRVAVPYPLPLGGDADAEPVPAGTTCRLPPLPCLLDQRPQHPGAVLEDSPPPTRRQHVWQECP